MEQIYDVILLWLRRRKPERKPCGAGHATGDGLTQQVFQGAPVKGEHALYTEIPAAAPSAWAFNPPIYRGTNDTAAVESSTPSTPTVYSRPVRVLVVGLFAIMAFGLGNIIHSVRHPPKSVSALQLQRTMLHRVWRTLRNLDNSRKETLHNADSRTVHALHMPVIFMALLKVEGFKETEMEIPLETEVTLEPIRHEFLSDERIVELFPDPKLAEYVRAIRENFQLRYEQWQLDIYGNNLEP